MSLAAETVGVSLGGRRVLSQVSCRLAPGRVTGLVGPNGAGKSTLLRTLAGLLAPDAGRVTLDGEAITALDRGRLARAAAFLPQERIVHWPLSVRAVVSLGRLPHRGTATGSAAENARTVAAAMAMTDVAHLAQRSIGALSGGERARVLLARALAQAAPVILADEPTAGLDPAHAVDVFAHLRRLAADGRTIAVALHDLTLATRFCHDVVVLTGGRVLAQGACDRVMTPDCLSQAFGIAMTVAPLGGGPVVAPVMTARGNGPR